MCPLFPKLPSHPGCHTTLSRVPCAILKLVIHFKISSMYMSILKSLTFFFTSDLPCLNPCSHELRLDFFFFIIKTFFEAQKKTQDLSIMENLCTVISHVHVFLYLKICTLIVKREIWQKTQKYSRKMSSCHCLVFLHSINSSPFSLSLSPKT